MGNNEVSIYVTCCFSYVTPGGITSILRFRRFLCLLNFPLFLYFPFYSIFLRFRYYQNSKSPIVRIAFLSENENRFIVRVSGLWKFDKNEKDFSGTTLAMTAFCTCSVLLSFLSIYVLV